MVALPIASKRPASFSRSAGPAFRWPPSPWMSTTLVTWASNRIAAGHACTGVGAGRASADAVGSNVEAFCAHDPTLRRISPSDRWKRAINRDARSSCVLLRLRVVHGDSVTRPLRSRRTPCPAEAFGRPFDPWVPPMRRGTSATCRFASRSAAWEPPCSSVDARTASASPWSVGGSASWSLRSRQHRKLSLGEKMSRAGRPKSPGHRSPVSSWVGG